MEGAAVVDAMDGDADGGGVEGDPVRGDGAADTLLAELPAGDEDGDSGIQSGSYIEC